MTEKGFEFKLCSNGYNYLYKNNELYITEKGNYVILEQKGDVVELLNELAEENQQYENEIARLQLINNKLKDKDYTNYKKKIQELQEENTRLRQCLNEIYLISSRESVE